MKIHININIKVGRVVKYFVLSDLFFTAGWGFVEPVFSVFIIERVIGATLLTVGITAAIYWILKSIIEIPVANYLDRARGEKNAFIVLVGGLFLASLSAFAFSLVREVWELYAVQVMHAIVFAFYLPSWTAIFSRHLDRERISFDWSLDSAVAGIAAGVTGLLSGIIAEEFGFTVVFVMAGILSMIAAFILAVSPDIILPKPTHGEEIMKERTPSEIGI